MKRCLRSTLSSLNLHLREIPQNEATTLRITTESQHRRNMYTLLYQHHDFCTACRVRSECLTTVHLRLFKLLPCSREGGRRFSLTSGAAVVSATGGFMAAWTGNRVGVCRCWLSGTCCCGRSPLHSLASDIHCSG